MTTWKPIESAPRDGTCIQAKIWAHGSDNIIAWYDGLIDSEERACGGWVFMEGEPPECWTDGICWDVNEAGERSAQPTHWKPLPDDDQGEPS